MGLHTRVQYIALEQIVDLLIINISRHSGDRIFGNNIYNKVNKLKWYILDLKFDTKVK